jgi:hypothetical protein
MNYADKFSFAGMLILTGVSCMVVGLATGNTSAQLGGLAVFACAVGYFIVIAMTIVDEGDNEDGYYED